MMSESSVEDDRPPTSRSRDPTRHQCFTRTLIAAGCNVSETTRTQPSTTPSGSTHTRNESPNSMTASASYRDRLNRRSTTD